MEIRLCSDCGEEVPPGQACPRCAAPEPAWVLTRRTFSERLQRLGERVASAVGGLACLGGAFIYCLDWIGPGLGQRVAQVLLGILVVGAGVPVGLGLLAVAFERIGHREWTHPSRSGRVARATTRFGRLLDASGTGRTTAVELSVPPSGLRGLEAFSGYGPLRRSLQRRLRFGHSPSRVDFALLVALLALAGRGRVRLRVSRDVSWSHDGRRLRRRESADGVELARADAIATDADPVEATLVGAMEAAEVPPPSVEGSAPYREPARAADAPTLRWAALPRVVLAITAGRPAHRRALRAEWQAAAPVAATREPEALLAELEATLAALPDANLAAVITQQVELGFSLRA